MKIGRDLAMTEMTLVLAQLIFLLDFKNDIFPTTHTASLPSETQNTLAEPEFDLREHINSVKDGPYLHFRAAA